MHKIFSISLSCLILKIALSHSNQAIAAEKLNPDEFSCHNLLELRQEEKIIDKFWEIRYKPEIEEIKEKAENEPTTFGKAEILAEAIDVYKNFMWEFSLVPTDRRYLSEFPKFLEGVAALYMDYARSNESYPLADQPKVAYFLKGVRILREIGATLEETLNYSVKIMEHLKEAEALFGEDVKKSGYFYITPGHLPVHTIAGHQRNSLVSHTQNKIYSALVALFKQRISENPRETFWSFCDKYSREIEAISKIYKCDLQDKIQEIILLPQ